MAVQAEGRVDAAAVVRAVSRGAVARATAHRPRAVVDAAGAAAAAGAATARPTSRNEFHEG